MSIPSILGPITNENSFMIASIQNSKPYILDGSPLGDGVIYYWNSGVTGGINSARKLPIFTADGPTDAVRLTDRTNGGGMAYRSDGVTLGNANVPIALNMSQTQFAPWFPPTIFISSVEYTVTNSQGATAGILTQPISATGPTGPAPTIPADNLIMLPATWYGNPSDGRCDQIDTPENSIINWFCLVDSGITGCAGETLLNNGWTTIDECVNDIQYQYCPTGEKCGTANCNGPCNAIYEDCDPDNGMFRCVINPEKFVTEGDWWSSPYFIGAVIGLVILTIIVIIAIFLFLRRGKKVPSESSELDTFLQPEQTPTS